jgi:hypothetical protein
MPDEAPSRGVSAVDVSDSEIARSPTGRQSRLSQVPRYCVGIGTFKLERDPSPRHSQGSLQRSLALQRHTSEEFLHIC